jgi:hypothetical protein
MHNLRAFFRNINAFKQLLPRETSNANNSFELISIADHTYTQAFFTHSLVSSIAMHLLCLDSNEILIVETFLAKS